jgi:DNA repair photolyase
MTLNKQKGNMYGFVTNTWCPIKGRCSHNCRYCFMKRWGPQRPIRLDERELKTDLGKGNYIFVGSSTDMWAWDIPEEWISQVLSHCRKYPGNKYLFQSKNPQRFKDFMDIFPDNTTLCATIETNRLGFNDCAPPVTERQWHIQQERFPVMITIEPIIDFDLDILVNWLKDIEPFQVNIGADSCGHDLPEPPKTKIEALIKELKRFTDVHLKDNLKRIMR